MLTRVVGFVGFVFQLLFTFGLVFLLCSYEVVLTLDKEKHAVDGPIYYYLFNTLLYCLLVLHIYWWVLMYRMLVKQIQARGQLSDDVRSGKQLASFSPPVHFRLGCRSSTQNLTH